MKFKNFEMAGFCQFFKDQVDLSENDNSAQIARITHVHRDLFLALNELGEEVSLKVKVGEKKGVNKLEYIPVVGDFVFYKGNPLATFSYIEKVFKRKNVLERVCDSGVQGMAANVDYALVCTSLNDNFNLNRIERYIALLKSSMITPIIVLTKIDIATIKPEVAQEMITKRFGNDIKIFCIGMNNQESLIELEEFFGNNKTIILLGSSGVGKSTLTNYFVGQNVQQVSEIREEDSKGRHTTVTRSLHLVKFGSVIDTPGMRGLGLGITTSELNDVFEEISRITLMYKFSNCTHTNEPDCMVTKMLESGELESSRYENYQKLLREAAYLERKTDINAYLAAKKEWKKVSRKI